MCLETPDCDVCRLLATSVKLKLRRTVSRIIRNCWKFIRADLRDAQIILIWPGASVLAGRGLTVNSAVQLPAPLPQNAGLSHRWHRPARPARYGRMTEYGRPPRQRPR